VIGSPNRHGAVQRQEALRQHADHLPAAGVPERDGIEHRAGAERGDEAVDARDLDQQAVEQADGGAEHEHHQDGQRPGQAQMSAG
jgi:hypothetical protein